MFRKLSSTLAFGVFLYALALVAMGTGHVLGGATEFVKNHKSAS